MGREHSGAKTKAEWAEQEEVGRFTNKFVALVGWLAYARYTTRPEEAPCVVLTAEEVYCYLLSRQGTFLPPATNVQIGPFSVLGQSMGVWVVAE